MPRGYTTRKLEVFALHIRSDEGSVDYRELFRWLASVDAEDRSHMIGDRLVAIPRLSVDDQCATLRAYEGERGINPLIFNATLARERIQRLRSGEIVATKTHALISLATREAIVEYNHRGAKAVDIAQVLEIVSRRRADFDDVTIELNPVADEAFVQALERFRRIRIASMRMARPNVDWTDHYNNLTAVAAESEARTVEVTFSADRGRSLAREGGVVKFIRDLAADTLSIFKGARIIGVREGETAETTISLGHFVEHQRISVRMTQDGHVEDADIERKIREYLNSRRRARNR
jgi:hypothetical protein